MLTSFENLRILKEAEDISDEVWELVEQWNDFRRDTVGKQVVRSADSVGANIAEMHGRFNYGEKIQFLYYARGSLFETKYWLNRMAKRGLADKPWVEAHAARLTELARQFNGFLSATKQSKRDVTYTKSQKGTGTLREDYTAYGVDESDDSLSLFTEEDLKWLASVG
jgi:four helix bundle protein